MGNGDGVNVAGFHVAEPRAHDGNDLRIDHPRQVTANRIVRQGRAVRTQRLNLAVRQKAQFDQGLEAIANTESQAIALVQEII